MAAGGKSKKATEVTVPVLLLPEGRKLVFERSFSSQRDTGIKRGFWNKLVDIVAGPPEFHHMERPYSVVTDSHDRIIVTDPGSLGIHIFDFRPAEVQVHLASRRKRCAALAAVCRGGQAGQHLRYRLGVGKNLCLRSRVASCGA